MRGERKESASEEERNNARVKCCEEKEGKEKRSAEVGREGGH